MLNKKQIMWNKNFKDVTELNRNIEAFPQNGSYSANTPPPLPFYF